MHEALGFILSTGENKNENKKCPTLESVKHLKRV
jgi:hypothetical protein